MKLSAARSTFALALSASLLIGAHARAEILPWLNEDPLGAQKKLGAYGVKLRPDICPALPDIARELKLNEVVIAVLCHNPDTKAAYLSLAAEADSYASSYSSYLPTIDGSLGYSRGTTFGSHSKSTSTSKSAGISASLLLYDFGQREISVEIAEQALIAAGHTYDSTMQGMIATALRGYYGLLTAQNALGVAMESERYAAESYEAAKVRHKLGLVPLADELQAKGSLSSAELATQRADNALSQAQATVALLMGLSADTPIHVAELDNSRLGQDPFDGQLRELMDKAKEKRVDLQASRASLKSAEASLRSLKRSQMATISAGVSSTLDNDAFFTGDNTRSNSIGVSVSIPIFNGFSDTYARHAARVNMNAQREQLFRSELDVENDVFTAWQNYETAKQQWDVTADQMAAATELRDVALGRYKEGIGSILDVLNAQLQYSNALQSELQTRFSLLTSRVDLVRAVGVLNLDNMVPEPTASMTEKQDSQ